MNQPASPTAAAVGTRTASSNEHAYVLGDALAERQRLDEQGANLRPLMQRFLDDLSLAPGSRVLDVGCGTGDVTLLAADIVGPSGNVVGVDRSTEVLGAARLRARGYPQVTFVQDDIAAFRSTDTFDAVIGRLVLIHQPDPTAVVRHLGKLVRPGGVIGFAEPVMLPGLAWPPRPLYTRCIESCVAALEGAGLQASMGLHMPAIFQQAGLPAPRLRLDGAITAGADLPHARWLAETVATLLPLMERLGIMTTAEAEPSTLVERLVAEAATAGGSACGFALVGAWVRLPA